ncbi:beta-ketoacyl synthase chain length factor [Dyadobacter sandarakinus]|uniref:Beta-ketoacyl synthase chain length factor n=1 Tax=Dyadobacter sandarakinus TaxID=2747268 RepID=A0ABX7I4Z6_9BACT|nr:beta-ketoacyl synthase chain length factor [Dyadobacter sandarakinus]QRR00945.1 beta-ketoacyl synthase chain length factor [Dyadobacter sandarakinus]
MYIIDLACISPQRTFDNGIFEGDIKIYAGDRYEAIEPGYGPLIPAGLLRRMGKAVRMGVGTGLPLVQKWDPDGIILATANGGLEDCLKFLNQIVDYDEGTLTPTNFVQSTPNAIAGNLAMMGKKTGYNATHVHKGLAFEAALVDALMLFEEDKNVRHLLVGSVEEISDYNHNIDFLAGTFKKGQYNSETLLATGTPGSVNGEGATMFILRSEAGTASLGRIRDVYQTSYLPGNDIAPMLTEMLERNALKVSDIDTVLLGLSGDVRTDGLYTGLSAQFFENSKLYTYKNLVGDYPTSSAWATWLAIQLFKGKPAPASAILATRNANVPRNILIYNHYKGIQHGLILLSAS